MHEQVLYQCISVLMWDIRDLPHSVPDGLNVGVLLPDGDLLAVVLVEVPVLRVGGHLPNRLQHGDGHRLLIL